MLFHFPTLAQTMPDTAPALPLTPPSLWHFNPQDWSILPAQLLHGLTVGGVTILVGLLLTILLRAPFRRLRLFETAAVAVLAMALYFGLLSAEPHRMADPFDNLAYWLHRGFAVVFTLLGLRFFDRLVTIPILSRGGKLEVPRLLHQIINIIVGVFALLLFGAYAFGWDIDKFLAGSAVVSIVLGLALQETLGNFFSGMVMQGSPPSNSATSSSAAATKAASST